MTAFPHTMPDEDILREHLQHEARVLAGQPRINLVAFVRNVFDSLLLERLQPKTSEDAQLYVTQMIEQRSGRKLNQSEVVKLGIVVATEWSTRAALVKIRRTCGTCGREFRLDEPRYHVTTDGPTKVCAGCLDDTRGVPSSTIREQMREEGLGVEDLDADEHKTCRHCPAILTEENTGKNYGGCCTDCEHIAHDEYLRYGRDD